MYPHPIEHYARPASIDEALSLLAQHGAQARVLAGGQSVMTQLKARSATPRCLIDINRVADFAPLAVRAGNLHCGAITRFAAVARDPEVIKHWTAFAQAARAIGDRQVRNRGTPIGSLVFAAAWGDIAPAVAVLDGEVDLVSSRGSRSLPCAAFIEGVGRTALAADELATALRLPAPAPNTGSAYIKHTRVAQDRATLGIACRVTRARDGSVAAIRIALGGVAIHPSVRLRAAEDRVMGRGMDPATLAAAAQQAQAEVAMQSDQLASADYRRALLATLVPRAIELAWTGSA